MVELLCIDNLDNAQLAQVLEKLEAAVSNIQSKIPIIERTEVVAESRFDPILRAGLRLP